MLNCYTLFTLLTTLLTWPLRLYL